MIWGYRHYTITPRQRDTLLCYHFQGGRFCISRAETPDRQGEVNKKTWNFGPDNSYLKVVLYNFTRLCSDKTKANIWSSKTSKLHEGGFCSSCVLTIVLVSAHFSNTLTIFRVPEQFGLYATHNISPLRAYSLTNLWQSFCHFWCFLFFHVQGSHIIIIVFYKPVFSSVLLPVNKAHELSSS